MMPSTAACTATALAALALTACAGVKTAPAGDCRLEFLFEAPSRPFERLADLQRHVQRPPPGGAWEALRPEACALGADAVVVERNQVLNYLDQTMVEGYAIRWRVEPPPAPAGPPEPPAPAAEAPAAPPPVSAPPATPPATPEPKRIP